MVYRNYGDSDFLLGTSHHYPLLLEQEMIFNVPFPFPGDGS